MYQPESVKVIRVIEKDEKGRFKNDGGFILLKYEIDDKYDVSISAHAKIDKVNNENSLVENEFESISIETTVRYHGEPLPRMKRSYKQKGSPFSEGFELIGNYRDRLNAELEFIDIIEYVEDNIINKVFNIVFNEEQEIIRIVRDAMDEF